MDEVERLTAHVVRVGSQWHRSVLTNDIKNRIARARIAAQKRQHCRTYRFARFLNDLHTAIAINPDTGHAVDKIVTV